jgi:hypothetical protein
MPQGIENLVALLSIHHQLPGAQGGQMLGKVSLLDGQQVLNGTREQFTVS